MSEISTKLSQVCATNNWGFISHEDIDGTHLNSSGVHLNKQGTATMAQNIRIFLGIVIGIDFQLQVLLPILATILTRGYLMLALLYQNYGALKFSIQILLV